MRQKQRKSMRKGQKKGDKGHPKLVQTKVTELKFRQLENLVSQTKGETISSLVRKILENKTIRVYTHDESLDLLMEELAANRAEILKIGVNINQMAKLFNTYPQLRAKIFYAKQGYERFLLLESRIDKLLDKVEQLSFKWLSE